MNKKQQIVELKLRIDKLNQDINDIGDINDPKVELIMDEQFELSQQLNILIDENIVSMLFWVERDIVEEIEQLEKDMQA